MEVVERVFDRFRTDGEWFPWVRWTETKHDYVS